MQQMSPRAPIGVCIRNFTSFASARGLQLVLVSVGGEGPRGHLGASSGSSVASPLAPHVVGGHRPQGFGFEPILVDEEQHNQACELIHIGASRGTLGLIGCIGLLPFCGWKPWADEYDANQACKFLGAPLGSSASRLSVVGGLASVQAPGCLLGLIGGIRFLPFFGWKPWAVETDENQACKLPAASASCPLVVRSLGPVAMMRIGFASS